MPTLIHALLITPAAVAAAVGLMNRRTVRRWVDGDDARG